jgi:hypothetical protein
LSSKHSGVPEDSKSPTFQVLGFTPTLGQVRVATKMLFHANDSTQQLVGWSTLEEYDIIFGSVLTLYVAFKCELF